MKNRQIKLIILYLTSISFMTGCQTNSENTSIDGLNAIKMSQNNSVHSEPTWLHEGSQLAVEIDGQAISILNIESGDWEKIDISGYSYIKAPMAWNQNTLSFIGIDPDKEFFKDKSIIIWDLEHKKQTKLIDNLPTIYSVTWNQYNQLVYTKDSEEFDVIFYDLKTKKEELLFRNGYSVQWHPDGKKVGYISDDKIYVYDLTDKTNQLIYSSDEGDLIDSLTWSPNGEWMAFLEGNYKSEIGMYVVSQDGESKEQLVENDVASLAWSPKGNQIAFTTIGSPGSNELFLLEVPEKYR